MLLEGNSPVTEFRKKWARFKRTLMTMSIWKFGYKPLRHCVLLFQRYVKAAFGFIQSDRLIHENALVLT